MSANSKIEWTHHTFNPWWGCAKVSPACERCYAQIIAARFRPEVEWRRGGTRSPSSDAYWDEPLNWDRRAAGACVRRRVFAGSMCDVFEDHPIAFETWPRLARLIDATRSLDWLLLTKRPENAHRLVPMRWLRGRWPVNAWLGVTAEDQERWDERVPELLELPAPVHFVSCEPLLGQIDITKHVDWVIAGCESGRGAWETPDGWYRDLAMQCSEGRIPFFLKQAMVGGKLTKLPELDGRRWEEVPR